MKYLLILLAILVSFTSYSQTPTTDEVNQMAISFLNKKNSRQSLKLKNAQIQQIKDIKSVEVDGQVMFHVAELEPQGFVVMSNDKRIDPVIAYSENSIFSYNTDSTNVLYGLLINDLSLRSDVSNEEDKWKGELTQLKSANTEEFRQWPEEGTTSTGGWVETTWHQGSPYNALLPLDPSTGVRVATGCVPVALSQIVNYHKNIGEFELNEEYRYRSWARPATFFIDDDSELYDFASFDEINSYLSSIREKYDSNSELTDNEISALQFMAGILVKTKYTCGGSGTSNAYLNEIEGIFKSEFGYSSCDVSNIFDLQIYQSLKNNIRLGEPAYLGLGNSDSHVGHAVICDGYNTDNYFHLNFGWGEYLPNLIQDAWYLIPENIPNYRFIDDLIYNIHPQSKNFTVSKDYIELFSGNNLSVSDFTIVSDSDTEIDLFCNSFMISVDAVNYYESIENIEINAGQEKTIWVKYSSDIDLKGYVEILENDVSVDYVNIIGHSEGNIISAGKVNGIWSEENNPYIITGDVTLNQNSSLTIKEGVRIYFMNHSTLTVRDGKLNIEGTIKNPVTLTSFYGSEKWGGIDLLNSGDDDIIKHAIILNSESTGIYVDNSNPKILNCYLTNNDAGMRKGGGLTFINSEALIEGCIIVNNSGFYATTSINAGAIYLLDSKVDLSNSTISKNSGSFGGIYCAGKSSELRINNSIIWDNKGDKLNPVPLNVIHPEISFHQINKPKIIVNSSIIKDINIPLKVFCGGGGTYVNADYYNYFTSDNIIVQDPLFQNPSNSYGPIVNPFIYDWSLKGRSPAINSGKNEMRLLLENDIEGNTRPMFDIIDIGAIEVVDTLNYLSINPFSFLDFPLTSIDSFSVQSIKLKNNGFETISVSYSFSKNDGDFFIENQQNNVAILPNDSMFIRIRYMPDEGNNRDTSTLIITSNSFNIDTCAIQLYGSSSFNGNRIEGEVSGYWNKEEGPYYIVGDTWVKEGDSLIVNEGVECYINGMFSLSVTNNSKIKILGTENDSVNFIGLRSWGGFELKNCNQLSSFQYFKIENITNSSGILIDNSPVRITNSLFTNVSNCLTIKPSSEKPLTCLIENNTFSDNKTYNIINIDGWPNCDAYKLDKWIIKIENNVFLNNRVDFIMWMRCNSDLFVNSNRIANNYIQRSPIFKINYLVNMDDTLYRNTFTKNIIVNNECINYVGFQLGSDNGIIAKNLIVNNKGFFGYTATFIKINRSKFKVYNNTFANNDNAGEAVILEDGGAIELYNNIFYKNNNNKFYLENGQYEMGYNLCNNEFSNVGNNFNANPLFNNYKEEIGPTDHFNLSDWYLSDDSPCIDAGHPDSLFNDRADRNNPEYAIAPSKGKLRNDIGAFGGDFEVINISKDEVICSGDNYLGRTEAGNYIDTVYNIFGCDTIFATSLTVQELPSPYISFNADTLTSATSYSSYQWYDQDGVIEGETLQQCIIQKSGTYYLEVTDENGCSAMSSGINLVKTGINDLTNNHLNLVVIPNPNDGMFRLRLEDATIGKYQVQILNELGQLQLEKEIYLTGNVHEEEFELSHLSSGNYFVKVTDGITFKTKKIILR